MALPSFSAPLAGTFTFSRGPEAPDTVRYTPRQSVQASDNGTLYVYAFGREEVQIQLRFGGLPRSDWTGLLAFVRAVNWSETAYTYTDSDGTDWIVRLAPGGLQVERTAADTYSVQITMLDQPTE